MKPSELIDPQKGKSLQRIQPTNKEQHFFSCVYVDNKDVYS